MLTSKPDKAMISTVESTKTLILGINLYQIGINMVMGGAFSHFL